VAKKFDLGDEVYGFSPSTGALTRYKVSKVYDGDADYYVKVERTSNLFLNSSSQEEFMVDEHLTAVPLKRKIILEKWKK
jgi:hypothetical protein